MCKSKEIQYPVIVDTKLDQEVLNGQIMEDKEAIVGFWKLVAVVQDDLQLQYCDIGTITEITPTHIRHIKNGSALGSEYDLDPNQYPKALDLFIQRPDFVIRKIYELNGNELRVLHHGCDHKVRPTSMTGIKGDEYLSVHVFKRSKWRPPANPKSRPMELLEPGSLIPKAFLKKNKP